MSKISIGVVIVAVLTSALAGAKPAAQSWGEAVNGLQMSVSQDEDAQGPKRAMHIRVEFRNSGQKDISIETGFVHGCGLDNYYTGQVTLTLVDSLGTRHRHLPFWGDGPPYRGGICGGNLTAFVVPLPPGASFSLPLDLGKYFDLSDSKEFSSMTRFPAGTYSLQAELILSSPGIPNPLPRAVDDTITFTQRWSGTAVSNVLQVHFDSEFAAALGDMPTPEEKAHPRP